jgi:uncharacterized protein YtpQ (UPF0354 family)
VKTDEVILRVLPQFFPKHWLDSPGMVFTDFPSRVRIGYVLRATSDYSYIMENDLAALRLSVEELHAAALGNLERLPSASISIGKVPGGAEGWLSATDDNFAAVRILLPAVQEQFSQVLGAEFLLTIPHRDDCFCWSLTQSQDRQAKHARDALNDFLHDQYNLTPDVLLCRKGEFQLHLEQDVESGRWS